MTAEKEIKKVLQTREGNAAEVNLLLIAMLRKAGLKAWPVILNTMGRPKADERYPVYDRYNNTVCILRDSNDNIMLDASGKYNAFGRLPYYCYNGYARMIDDNFGLAIVMEPKANKERISFNLKIENLSATTFTIHLTEILGMNASRFFRQKFADDTSKIEGYIRSVYSKEGRTTNDISCSNFSNADTNIILQCTINKIYKLDLLYFTANQVKFFENNPFKPMKRTMPVELPYQTEYLYTLNGFLPQGIQPEELLKPVELHLDNNRIIFKETMDYDKGSGYFSVTAHYKRPETFFKPSEYAILREFTDKVIEEENKTIVFKFN